MVQEIFKKYIPLLACMQPLLLLTVKGWGNGILIICSLIALVYLILYLFKERQIVLQFSNQERWFILAFSSPIIATIISAAIRKDTDLSQYDSPSRFILALLIYIAFRNTKIELTKYLMSAIAISAGITLIYLISRYYFTIDVTRVQTHFMDPIMLGYISLSFGFMLLYFFSITIIDKKYIPYLYLISGLIFIYISISTQTRTGWASVFPIMIIFIKKSKIKTDYKIIYPIVFAIGIAFTLLIDKNLEYRFFQISEEISNYNFDNKAPDSSIGLRITYIRIAKELIFEKPISGHGDTAKISPIFPKAAEYFASDYAKDSVFKVGFHNELIANTVHSGVLGGISLLMVFVVPLFLSIKHKNSNNKVQKNSAGLCIIFVCVVAISSLTIETFGLKFAVSYYACIVSLLMIKILNNHKINNSL